MKAAVVILNFTGDVCKRVRILLSALKAVEIEQNNTEIIIFGENIKYDYELSKLPCVCLIACSFDYFSIESYSAELILDTLNRLRQSRGYDLILFEGDIIENELATRAGVHMDGSVVLNIEEITLLNEQFIVKKPVYSHNLKADILMKYKPYICSLVNALYKPCQDNVHPAAQFIGIELTSGTQAWLENVRIDTNTEEGLFDSARIIIVGGRGVSGKNGMSKLQELADAMNGVLGGTRPAVLNGWIENNRLIGISGKIVSPELCLTFGVSGCMPLMAGIENSKVIVSINNDEVASVFKGSDVGICDDYSDIADQLLELLKKYKESY